MYLSQARVSTEIVIRRRGPGLPLSLSQLQSNHLLPAPPYVLIVDMLTMKLLQKAFGTNYGLTAKVPKDAFHLTAGTPKVYKADNGAGIVIYREFCDNCGSFILEYGVGIPQNT